MGLGLIYWHSVGLAVQRSKTVFTTRVQRSLITPISGFINACVHAFLIVNCLRNNEFTYPGLIGIL